MLIRKEYSPDALLKSKSNQLADEFNVMDRMRKQIREGDFVCKCPICEFGFICCDDHLEKIGYCDGCFEEFKLL